ncbi:MAG: hypothetical protein OXC48_10170, partial [Endozoicomonadaceae bacterium]|nr:hypothetical protein [Endozoicomonadaceae bacterium]
YVVSQVYQYRGLSLSKPGCFYPAGRVSRHHCLALKKINRKIILYIIDLANYKKYIEKITQAFKIQSLFTVDLSD